MRIPLILFATALAATSLASAQTPTARKPHSKPAKTAPAAAVAPEIIYYGALIYTGEGFSQDKPQTAEAMAVSGGKVIAVGSLTAMTKLSGPHTRLHDLGQVNGAPAFIFPGFNDAHTHIGSAGRTKLNVDLTGTKSLAAMQAAIQAYAAHAPSGHWLTGGNWDQTLWDNNTLPTRKDIDKATGSRPAFLQRIDGHIAIANSAALAKAGITARTAVPQGGQIDLDDRGKPTGILRESAQDLVAKLIPPPTHDERRQADELAINDAITHGVTSVQDFSDWEDFLVFEEMEKEGKLHLRITEWLPFAEPLENLKQMRAHHDLNDPMLHTGLLKGFMDGSLGSRTAAMKAPYSDDPSNSGLPQFTQAQLNKMALERAQAGFQLGFHAIGDQAAEMALNAYAQPGMTQDARNRIEHAQVVDPADIPRFVKLGVIASMQPCHLLTDMNWAEDRLGPQRAASSYAWKAFLDAGVPLAFGTDYPVEPINPFRGLYAAVTRMNEAGTREYFPQNKLTRGQALSSYTQGSAYAEFAEKHKGKLAPGYDADFILVDRDLYKAKASELLHATVLQTFVAGEIVYAGSPLGQ
jgi:predicted amidohydrolase YtcJ